MGGCYCGGEWKVVRKDKQTTDEGTKIILHLKCKLCGAKFQTDEIDDEPDYDDLRDVIKQEVE